MPECDVGVDPRFAERHVIDEDWHANGSAPRMVETGIIDELLASDIVDDPARSAAAEPARAKLTARRRRLWGEEASLAAVTLSSLASFFALTRFITGKRGNAFDRAVVRAMGEVRHPFSNAIMQAITFLGSFPGAGSISLASVYLARRRPRLAWQVVAGAVGGSTAELAFKRLFRRERPTLLAHLEDAGSTSFPSGHSMAAASIYLTLAFVASRSPRLQHHRSALLGGATVLAASVGATRVYLGVHWPTDVLGGLALGTAWACVAEAVCDLTGADRVERGDQRVPHEARHHEPVELEEVKSARFMAAVIRSRPIALRGRAPLGEPAVDDLEGERLVRGELVDERRLALGELLELLAGEAPGGDRHHERPRLLVLEDPGLHREREELARIERSDVGEERFDERPDVLERPAAVAAGAGTAPACARPHRGLVFVALGAKPPRVHHVVGADLRGRDVAVLVRVPLGRDRRVRDRERGLGNRALRAARVLHHEERRALVVVRVRATPPRIACVRDVDGARGEVAVLLGVPELDEARPRRGDGSRGGPAAARRS